MAFQQSSFQNNAFQTSIYVEPIKVHAGGHIYKHDDEVEDNDLDIYAMSLMATRQILSYFYLKNIKINYDN